jgi:hypothetical protein
MSGEARNKSEMIYMPPAGKRGNMNTELEKAIVEYVEDSSRLFARLDKQAEDLSALNKKLTLQVASLSSSKPRFEKTAVDSAVKQLAEAGFINKADIEKVAQHVAENPDKILELLVKTAESYNRKMNRAMPSLGCGVENKTTDSGRKSRADEALLTRLGIAVR